MSWIFPTDFDWIVMAKRILEDLSATEVLDLFPPFPIVLVTTRTNIITVNQVEYFTFTPLRIGIGIAHQRFSFSLLKREGEFVINIPHSDLVEQVKLCGEVSGRSESKYRLTGLESEPSSQVGAASIRQCRAHIECRVERIIDFEKRSWFVGRVVAARSERDYDAESALLCGRHAYKTPGCTVCGR
jgi:flavin reductase (DIM6/NTAB) family NADH-FMN oxidoreductase RutF